MSRLEALFRATGEVMEHRGTTDLEEQLQKIAEVARDVLQAEACGIFLVKDQEHGAGKELSLEASAGHREGGFVPGRRLPIISHPGCGLTSHIAWQRELFNRFGDELLDHPAVHDRRNLLQGRYTRGRCWSLIALPLIRRTPDGEELVGLLRADNKLAPDGSVDTSRGFDSMDEWIIRLFGDSVIVAIENAELVYYRSSLIGCPSGIIAVDRQGRLTEYNSRAAQILGRPREEVLHKPVSDLYYDPDEPRRIGALLHQRGGRLRDYHTNVKGPSGEPIPIVHSSTWLYSGGRRIGSVGYFEDDRPRLRIESREQLLQAIDLVAKADDLETGLWQFTERIVSLLSRSYCAVLLRDESGERLYVRAATRTDRPEWQPSPKPIAIGEPPAMKELWTTREPVLLTWSNRRNVPALQRLSKLHGYESNIPSLLIVPLTLNDRVIGQIHVGARRGDAVTPFTEEEETEVLQAMAGQVSAFIYRLNLVEQTRFRERRLADLARVAGQLRNQAEISALLQQVTDLAASLVQYSAAGIFLRYQQTSRLELKAVHGLSPGLRGVQAEPKQLIEQVAEGGKPLRAATLTLSGAAERSLLRDVIAVPLRRGTGEVEGVLFVGDKRQAEAIDTIDEDVLERFAALAASALQTSRLLGDEDRIASHFEVLDRIVTYILQTDDDDRFFLAFLTGVTAGFGLRFNRAFLLLLDESGKYLVGRRGIGELDPRAARQAWRHTEQINVNHWAHCRELIDDNALPLTKVDGMIRDLRFALDGSDMFAKAIRTGEVQVVEPHDFHRLPRMFFDLFRVTSTLVIVPLKTKKNVYGIVVADNKFTRAPVEPTLVEALMEFSNAVAIPWENKKLLHESLAGKEQLRSFYTMGSTLAALTEPEMILRAIVDHTFEAADAWGVSLLLYDAETGNFRHPVRIGADVEAHTLDAVRRDSQTMEVMRSGKPVRIEDVASGGSPSPQLLERGIKAALCLPLSLPNRRLGVVWIHYDHPRRFTESMVAALQLFVNQAAFAYEQATRIKALETIRDAVDALTAIESVAQVLGQILESARRILDADAAILWFYDRGRGEFLPQRSVRSSVPDNVWEGLRVRALGSVKAHVTQRRIVHPDIEKEGVNRHLDADTLALLQSMSVRGFQAVALSVGEEDFGVLWTLHQQPLGFDAERQFLTEELAAHAAWALKKAPLLERVTKVQVAASVVSEVAKAGHQSRAEALRVIAERAMYALRCDAVVLFENDEVEGIVHPGAAAGVTHVDRLRSAEEKNDYDLVELVRDSPDPILASNVLADPRFQTRRFVEYEGIRSCAALPLHAAGHVVGVMFVNHRTPHDFTTDEVEDIQLFANQIAIAIHASQVMTLARVRTDLAWIGLKATEWSHELGGTVGNIVRDLTALREEIAAAGQTGFAERLDAIGAAISSVGLRPRREYDKPDAHVCDVAAEVLGPFTERLRRDRDFEGIHVVDEIELGQGTHVKASGEWLRGVLFHLARNARAAFDPSADEKRLTIAARRDDRHLEIRFTDNGPGIPEELVHRIFREPMPKAPGAPGLGIGLLIAHLIVQIFGGRITFQSVQPHGTSVLLRLPLLTQEATH
ncbi:MAG TPA: GAF domain-containing protein [Thermoanaerobaculia bacterium]|nr:GAF domain-containing protein [Thermoanaerobaculia bacterium]